METLKVFIGSGEASLLERKTLIYSLKKNCRKHPIDIYVFNGTHNSLEHDGDAPVLTSLPLDIKYTNVTEFSNYRFLIPEICGHKGRALWVDSDTICLSDLAELFQTDMLGADFLAKASAYDDLTANAWGLSVSLIDCKKTRFDIKQYFTEIKRGLYTYTDLHLMTPKFLQHHPFKIGKLDANWNSFDRVTKTTKLIHYTNLHTQPWKFTGHPFGKLWYQYFNEARQAGFVTDRDIELSIDRGYVRPTILEGNNPSLTKSVYRKSKKRLRSFARGLKGQAHA